MHNKLLQLVPIRQRQLLANYLQFWQSGNLHFCRTFKDASLKTEKIRLLEKALRCRCALPNSLLAKLQQQYAGDEREQPQVASWTLGSGERDNDQR